MNQIRKPQYGFWIFLGIIALYVGYLVSGIFIEGKPTLETISGSLEHVFRNPIKNYWNAMTPKCLLAAIIIWMIAFLNHLTRQGNYMPGQEYGTARWKNIKKFNRQFEDKDSPDNNRILTDKARISYDSHKTGINNNMTIVGGSGAGKTAYAIAPNLLQFHGSNVYTDPKGGLIEDFGNILLTKGIQVKCLNLCEMQKSMGYNPFLFIRKPSDVSKLITNIISNTTPADVVSSADPFWESATCSQAVKSLRIGAI